MAELIIKHPKKKVVALTNAVLCAFLLLVGGGLGYVQLTHQKLLSVQSGSMTPAIHKGDLVVVRAVAPSVIKVGDVITFESPEVRGQTITHRVVRVDATSHKLYTKGDANATADRAGVGFSKIVGRVDHILPYAGHFINWVRTPVGLALIIYLPALLVIGGELRRLSGHYRWQEQQRRSRQQLAERWRAKGTKGLKGPKRPHALPTNSILLLASALLTGTSVTFAVLGDSVLLTSTTLQSAPIPQTYTVCQFPNNESLLSYAPEDALFPEQSSGPLQLTQSIAPGTYRVTAVSTDTHLANPNAPTQPNERWFLQLYTAGSLVTPAYTTGVTADLANNQDQNTTILNSELQITRRITGIRYAHNAMQTGLEITAFNGRRYDDLSMAEKRQVIWNSVHPACVTFTRVTTPPVSIPEL